VTGTVTVTATATDNVGVTRVELYADGLLQGTASSSPYSFSWNSRTGPNADRSLTLRAFDAAGNIGVTSIWVTSNNDLTAPAVTFSAPSTGATVTGTVPITVTASDNVGVTRVEFYEGSTLLGTDTSAPYSLGWDTRTSLNGSRTLTVKAYDAVDNIGAATRTVTVSNDHAAPTVAFTAPAEGATVSGTLTLTATATDDVRVTRVEFYEGDTLLGTDTAAPFTFTWNTRLGPNGGRVLTAKAHDGGGNTAAATVTVTADNDLTPPTVTLTAPTEGETLSGMAVLSATASDNKAVTRVVFFVGTTQVGTDTSAPYSYNCNTRLLPNGAKVLTAKAYDAANNVATSAAVNVTFDNDFTLPTVALTEPEEGATLTGTVTFSATASDASGISKVVFFAGSSQVGIDTTEPYSYSYNTRLLPNGAKVLTAKAYDAANNVATSAAVNVTFDNDFIAPVTSLTSPSGGSTVSGVVQLDASASDDRGTITQVDFYRGTVLLGTDTSAPYSWSWDTTAAPLGTNTLRTRAWDAAGNSAYSTNVAITVTR
jgi:hypothetical protein